MAPRSKWTKEYSTDNLITYLDMTHEDGRHHLYKFDTSLLPIVQTINWSVNYKHNMMPYLYGWNPIIKHPQYLHCLYFTNVDLSHKFIDHIDRDVTNNLSSNLRVVTPRISRHNTSSVSPYGTNIRKDGNGIGYTVSFRFDRKRLFSPYFNNLDKAKLCRDEYMKIAQLVDNGKRDNPTKEELKIIADRIKR